MLKLLAQHAGCVALELIGEVLGRIGRWGRDEQVDVIGHDFQTTNRRTKTFCLLVKQNPEAFCNPIHQHGLSILRTPHEVINVR